MSGDVIEDRGGRAENRGSSADRPSEIAPRDWKDILLCTWRGISEDRIFANAAGVTFYALLALFPGIAALVSIYGLFADPSTIAAHLDSLSNILPSGALAVVHGQLTRLTSKGGTTLSVSFAVGLVVSLWSANSGTKALFDALNVVYGEKERRGFIRLNAVSLGVTLAGLALALLSIGGVIGVPILLAYFPGAIATVSEYAVWPVLLAAVALGLSAVYCYGPSRTAACWQWASWGGVVAAFGWLAVSVLFSWYAANFGRYDKTYGSLGAIIGFMTWIWLSAAIVLIGGKLNAELERHTGGARTQCRPERPARD
jgi:membrane protein